MYSNVDDDIIYTFITRYKNYLLYEELSPEKRVYNKREQTMFVFNALTFDKQLKEGLTYVEATLQDFQRDSRVSSMNSFPLDLEIDEIKVIIDERSNNYVVSNKIASAQVINPYAKSNIRMLETTYIASILAMGRRNQPRNDDYKKVRIKKRDDKPASRNTQMCKLYLGMGNYITNPDTIYYNVATQQMCSKYLDIAENVQAIKSNAYRYKKDRKEKASRDFFIKDGRIHENDGR